MLLLLMLLMLMLMFGLLVVLMVLALLLSGLLLIAVLDPFMGIGTTAIAAMLLNRNFIGFELNKEYIKIAERRLKEMRRDGLDGLVGEILGLS